MTKIMEVLNTKKASKGYSPATAYILKLLETKGKIRREETKGHCITFDDLLKDGFIKSAGENGYYELTEDGVGVINTYKKFNKRRYENLKL